MSPALFGGPAAADPDLTDSESTAPSTDSPDLSDEEVEAIRANTTWGSDDPEAPEFTAPVEASTLEEAESSSTT